MGKIRTIDGLTPSNVLFKMNSQCVETDNIALYRKSGDGYIRNEYYKIKQQLPHLPDLSEPSDHLHLFREGNRSPYRATPRVVLPVHENEYYSHNNTTSGTSALLTSKTVASITEPFDISKVLILWSQSNKNANINFTEFPVPRHAAYFHVFAPENPVKTFRVYSYDTDSDMRTCVPVELVNRQRILGLAGELYSFKVIVPVEASALFLEYTNVNFIQGYQRVPARFADTIYFEDYPDRQLSNDVALRTKRTISATCKRDIPILGTPQSGLAIPLIPLFNQSYNPTGFALIENYVVSGRLMSFPRTISEPKKIRFTFSLDQPLELAALEFLMTSPANVSPDLVLPNFTRYIYPGIVLVESRLQETDSWQMIDEFNLYLLGAFGYTSSPNTMAFNAPRRFTNFKYCTYRRPIRQLRFTVQSLTNYTVLQPNGQFNISPSHFYFPQVLAYGHPPEKSIRHKT